ncbi:MAG TPA: amino acid ABC transporter substrate-binding protein [Desulfotignum sp.]|nr:amino acid ABC transporter substrate-binding protein [Desulfotignum sp.]
MQLHAKWVITCVCFLFLTGNVCLADDTAAPIRIGATVSLEGKFQEPSAMIQKAFIFWADEINQKGGLLGRRITLILYDDKSRPDLARALYKKLIEQVRVDLVFSPYSTPLTLAASEVSEQHEMVMMACAAAARKPWQRNFRYLFGLYAPANRQFIGLLDMMARKNHRTLSILYDETSAFNLDIVNGIHQWADTFDITIMYEQGFQDGRKALPHLVAAVKEKNAAGLILSAYPPDCYELLGLLQKEQYRPPVLAMPIAPVHPDFHKNAGDMADLVFSTSQWEPDERIPFPGTQRFVEKFTKFAGHLPSFHAVSAYAACRLYEQAVVQTESLDNKRLRDYIFSLDTVTLLGRFKVDHTGMQIGHNPFIIQWQKGKKQIVWPRKLQTAAPVL